MTRKNLLNADCHSVLASFAADLASAAYSVTLPNGICGSWLDLQLAVWRAISKTIAKLTGPTSAVAEAADFACWRECLVSRLTDAAYRAALRQGFRGSFLNVELALNAALSRVVDQYAPNARLRDALGAGGRIVADAVVQRMEEHEASTVSQPAQPVTQK